MEPPEASGFALALDSYLAQGGGRRMSGKDRDPGWKFTKGKLRGKTLAEATMDARRMWAGASPAVKEKYARMAREGMLAPSEQAGWAGPGRDAGVVRHAVPGDHNGDGVPDPGYFRGPGRRPEEESGAPTPAETERAQAGLRDALEGRGDYGGSAAVGRPSREVSTDSVANPGIYPNPGKVAAAEPAWVGRPSDRSPEHRAELASRVVNQARPSEPPMPTSDDTPTPAGKVWVGWKGGRKVFQDGDPSAGGTAPPAGYDPRSGRNFAGPRPAADYDQAGRSAKDRYLPVRPDVVAARREDEAEERRKASVTGAREAAGRSRRAFAKHFN